MPEDLAAAFDAAAPTHIVRISDARWQRLHRQLQTDVLPGWVRLVAPGSQVMVVLTTGPFRGYSPGWLRIETISRPQTTLHVAAIVDTSAWVNLSDLRALSDAGDSDWALTTSSQPLRPQLTAWLRLVFDALTERRQPSIGIRFTDDIS